MIVKTGNQTKLEYLNKNKNALTIVKNKSALSMFLFRRFY